MKILITKIFTIATVILASTMTFAADGPCGKIQNIQRQSNTGVLFTVTLTTGEKLTVREDFATTPLITAMAADLTVCFRKLGPDTYLTDSFSK
jgi:hypothetical protein